MNTLEGKLRDAGYKGTFSMPEVMDACGRNIDCVRFCDFGENKDKWFCGRTWPFEHSLYVKGDTPFEAVINFYFSLVERDELGKSYWCKQCGECLSHPISINDESHRHI